MNKLLLTLLFPFYLLAQSISSPTITLNSTTFEQLLKDEVVEEMMKKGLGKYVNQLIFSGFKPGTELTISTKRPLQSKLFSPRGTFKILSDKSFSLNDQVSKTPFMVGSEGFLPGEPFVLRFKGKDFLKDIELTPYPLDIQTEGELSVKVTLTSAKPTIYLYEIKGLLHGELYHLTSESGGELIEHDENYSRGAVMHLPEVIGLAGGMNKVTISSFKGKIVMNLPWGKELTNHYVYEDKTATISIF